MFVFQSRQRYKYLYKSMNMLHFLNYKMHNLNLFKYNQIFQLIYLRYYSQERPYHWKKIHEDHRLFLQNFGKKSSRTNNICVSDESLSMLCNTFDLAESKCSRMVKFKLFESCQEDDLATTAKFLRENGVTAKHVTKAPWLLLLKKDELIKKLPLLTLPHLFENIVDGLGFCLFDPLLIKQYDMKFRNEAENYPHHRNRIYYIADRLNLPVDLFTLKVIYSWKVLHILKSRMDRVIEVLLEFYIHPEDILSDTWILCFNSTTARTRLQSLKDAGSKRLKPWVCRAKEEIFVSHCTFKKGYTQTGPYEDIATLLKEELGINNSEFIWQSFKMRKVNSIYNNLVILKKLGFDKETLRNNLALLYHSPKKIMKRKQQLDDRGITLVTPYLASQKKYENFLKQFDESESN